MKRNTLLVTIVSILMIFAFVSCSNNVAPEDQLGNISFADNSRALKTSVKYSEEVETLYWYYTATKADDGYTTGTAVTYTAVKDTTGLKDSVLKNFSYGYWNIELRGFTESNKPTAYDSSTAGDTTADQYNSAADAKAEFKATLTRFLVKASNNNATAEVKMGDGATTEIEFGEITFTADNILATSTFTLSVVDTNKSGSVTVTEDGKTVEAGGVTYQKGKLTYTPNTGADISGAHEMTFVLAQKLNYTDGEETESSGTKIDVATYTLSFDAIKGTKTTIEGSLTKDEKKGDVTINNVIENLPAITIKKALKIVAADVTAGSTTAKSYEAQTLSYGDMTIAVPANAVIPASLANGSAVTDGSTATADAAVGWEVKNEVGSGIEIETGNDSINVELTLPVTTENTELVTVSNYIGTGLDIPKVYHAGSEIGIETSQAVPTDGEEGWFYNTSTGYIYLYVKHASEFNIVVKKSVAKIGDTSYLTLEEAFEAAESDNATITLLRDVTLSSAVAVSHSITLDMNNKVITLSGHGVVSIAKGKTLTVKNISSNQGDFTDAEVKIGEVYYPALPAAIESAQDGDTITLLCDIDVSETVSIKKKLTLDLDSHILSDKQRRSTNWSVICAEGNADLTITGDGTVKAGGNNGGSSFAMDLFSENAKVTIKSGTFIGNTDAIYVFKGSLSIEGGTFKIDEESVEEQWGYRFVINCKNDNYKNNTAKISVTGGTFVGFDPASDNPVPGDDGSYVAKGYKTIKTTEEGVVPATWEVVPESD